MRLTDFDSSEVDSTLASHGSGSEAATNVGMRRRLLHRGVLAIAYFLAARLGLARLSQHEGVAMFRPASGIDAGILIARGPNARVPVEQELCRRMPSAGDGTIEVILATVAANLMSDRSLLTSIAKSGCNAGEDVCVRPRLRPGELAEAVGSVCLTVLTHVSEDIKAQGFRGHRGC